MTTPSKGVASTPLTGNAYLKDAFLSVFSFYETKERMAKRESDILVEREVYGSKIMSVYTRKTHFFILSLFQSGIRHRRGILKRFFVAVELREGQKAQGISVERNTF